MTGELRARRRPWVLMEGDGVECWKDCCRKEYGIWRPFIEGSSGRWMTMRPKLLTGHGVLRDAGGGRFVL